MFWTEAPASRAGQQRRWYEREYYTGYKQVHLNMEVIEKEDVHPEDDVQFSYKHITCNFHPTLVYYHSNILAHSHMAPTPTTLDIIPPQTWTLPFNQQTQQQTCSACTYHQTKATPTTPPPQQMALHLSKHHSPRILQDTQYHHSKIHTTPNTNSFYFQRRSRSSSSHSTQTHWTTIHQTPRRRWWHWLLRSPHQFGQRLPPQTSTHHHTSYRSASFDNTHPTPTMHKPAPRPHKQPKPPKINLYAQIHNIFRDKNIDPLDALTSIVNEAHNSDEPGASNKHRNPIQTHSTAPQMKTHTSTTTRQIPSLHPQLTQRR